MNSQIWITQQTIRIWGLTSQQAFSQSALTGTSRARPPRKHQIMLRQPLSSKITIFNTRKNAVKTLILCSINSKISIREWLQTTILPKLRSKISSPLRKPFRTCLRFRRLQALTLKSWITWPPWKATSGRKRQFPARRGSQAKILSKKSLMQTSVNKRIHSGEMFASVLLQRSITNNWVISNSHYRWFDHRQTLLWHPKTHQAQKSRLTSTMMSAVTSSLSLPPS